MGKQLIQMEPVGQMIREIRGEKIMLDVDLARVYGVPTKRLNEQVRRNAARFPSDFLFRLTPKEWLLLKAGDEDTTGNRSQIATGSQRHRDPRLLPYAFTEHIAIMAANVLSSRRAVEMSIHVIRAFVTLRRESVRTHGQVPLRHECLLTVTQLKTLNLTPDQPGTPHPAFGHLLPRAEKESPRSRRRGKLPQTMSHIRR